MTGVVAIAADGCIGRGGALPWRYREDLLFFKELTLGGTLVLGRKTWDGLPRKPLPGREHVVLTRGAHGVAPRTAFTDLDGLDAELAGRPEPHFVIGGAEVYRALWARIDVFWVTRIPETVPGGDVWFDLPLEREFRLEESRPLSDRCTVERWERVQ